MNPLERVAQRATAWAERWMPDAFVFALGATLLCLVAAPLVDPTVRADPLRLADAWGMGFWQLIPFTLQMSMIIITGFVLATSPPIRRAIRGVAGLAGSARGAVLLVAVASMLSSLLNWGFSLIFSALLAREVARRVPLADYRALGAASFLGLGTVWAQGLSGSAALQMASPGSMPPKLAEMVAGGIPLTETIFRWQSLACVAVEIVVVSAVVWFMAPGEGRGRTAAAMGVDLGPDTPPPLPLPTVPGERAEHSPLLLLPVLVLGFAYLARSFAAKATSLGGAVSAFDFNTINLLFLLLGGLFHWTPASLMRAVRDRKSVV